MINLILYILILSYPSLIPGFSGITNGRDVVYKNYQVKIAGESHLVINGSTNVSNFSCGYNGELYRDTLTVHTAMEGNHLELDNARLKLRTALFDCENKLMNPDFQHLLKADQYPFITINVTEINENREAISDLMLRDETKRKLLISTEIMLAGRKNNYELPVKINRDNHERYYSGHLDIDIRDFGLTPPKKMLGLVVVNEVVRIDFRIKLRLI